MVIAVVRVVPAFAALPEPGVLVGAVVHHQVHEDFQAPFVGLLQHPAEELQVPEVRVDGSIVGYIVAVVGVGGGIERGKPDGVYVQALYIVQLFKHAVEVADAVSVAVPEAAGPDMVDGHLFVPLSIGHGEPPFRRLLKIYFSIVFVASQLLTMV